MFRFTWKVENFSLFGGQKGTAVSSPPFTVGDTEWRLKLYPKGFSNSFVSCDLQREKNGGQDSITVDWQLSLVIIPGMPSFKFDSVIKELTKGQSINQNLILIDEVIEKRNVIMPDDIFTLQCDLWVDSPADDISPQMRDLVSCFYDVPSDEHAFKMPEEVCIWTSKEVTKIKKHLTSFLNEITARTKFGVIRKTFTWAIDEFDSLMPPEKAAILAPYSSKRLPPFATIVYPQSDGKVQIDIRKLIGGDGSTLFVRCRIAVLNIDGRVHSSETKEYTFGNPKAEETWSFPSFITKKELTDNRRVCLPNDQLTLRFELEASTGVEFSKIEEYNFVFLDHDTSNKCGRYEGTLEEDLMTFHAEEKAHDFNVKVKDVAFPTHKAVLCFRSPVLCNMLEHDSTGQVDLSGMDPRTVSRMLEFMYTHKVELVNVDNTLKLYEAAEKYQILHLKKYCFEFLSTNLIDENLIGVFSVANRCSEEEFLNLVRCLMRKYSLDTLIFDVFDRFILKEPVLHAKILQGLMSILRFEAVNDLLHKPVFETPSFDFSHIMVKNSAEARQKNQHRKISRF